MTLEELYYISQIIAVIAIFGSLIFVGLQLRQNSEQMRAQTEEARYAAMNQILTDYDQVLSVWASDPAASQDYFVGVTHGLEAVSPDRRGAHIFQLSRMLRVYERAYIQRTAGRLGDNAWESIHRAVGPSTAGKSFKEYWQIRKISFSPVFVAHVDKEMERDHPIAFPHTFYAASGQPPAPDTQSTQL